MYTHDCPLYYHRENVTAEDVSTFVAADLASAKASRLSALGYQPNKILPVSGIWPLLIRFHGMRAAGGTAENETVNAALIGWPSPHPGILRREGGTLPRGMKLWNGVITFGPETAGTNINAIDGGLLNDPATGNHHEADTITIAYPTTPAADLGPFAVAIGDAGSTRAAALIHPLGCKFVFVFLQTFSANLNRVDVSVQEVPISR